MPKLGPRQFERCSWRGFYFSKLPAPKAAAKQLPTSPQDDKAAAVVRHGTLR